MNRLQGTTSASLSSTPLLLRLPWLFSPAVDLVAFLGSAVVALVLLFVGWIAGWVDRDAPEWMWVTAVLLIDVAHVYATGFRVYFDRVELRRRPWLYTLAPLLSFLIGLSLYSESQTLFWRTLAYLAVFHFIRQQYGWVALYRSRAGERGRVGFWIDSLAIYLATIYPLIYWHAHLPRRFWWFLADDFSSLPELTAVIVQPLYWCLMVLYAGRSLHRAIVYGKFNPGKDIVLLTTAVCWYVGIISFNSDYAFTVTNVIIHGVPYIVLVYWYRWVGAQSHQTSRDRSVARIVGFLGVIWVLAYVEELFWDRGVWHSRSWLFGSAWDFGAWELLFVPLLAVPQITHYLLDGFIWRRSSNRGVARMVASDPSASVDP